MCLCVVLICAGPNAKANIAALGALAEADKIDAVLHVGDISYANGIQRLWDDFMRQIEPVAARVPYMVLPVCVYIVYTYMLLPVCACIVYGVARMRVYRI